MAKGNRGGQRAGGVTSGIGTTIPITAINGVPTGATAQSVNAQQTNTQVDDTSTASAFGTDYNKFMAMTDDEKADVIANTIKQGVPVHLAQNDFQRFLYHSGLNDKPDVVDDATLNKMTGTEMFRTVNFVDDKVNDIGYTAPQIAKQIMSGKHTRVSDTGGSAHGRGIYFADSYTGSVGYGHTTGNVKATSVVRAKLNNNAKVMNESVASRGVSREISSGSKLGKVLSKCDGHSRTSIYAMAKGYNVIKDDMWNSGYLVVLNRNAITMSKDIRAKGSKW